MLSLNLVIQYRILGNAQVIHLLIGLNNIFLGEFGLNAMRDWFYAVEKLKITKFETKVGKCVILCE